MFRIQVVGLVLGATLAPFGCSTLQQGLTGSRRDASRIRPPADSTVSTAPVRVRGLPSARQLAVGAESACAVTRAGELRCWSLAAASRSMHAAPVVGLSDVTRVAVSGQATCVLRRSANAVCFRHAALHPAVRRNGAEVGERGAPAPLRFGMVQLPGTMGATQLSLFGKRGCLVGAEGGVRCWELGLRPGPAGQPFTTLRWRSQTGAALAALEPLQEVRLGAELACARSSAGVVHWWAPEWLDSDRSDADVEAEDAAESSLSLSPEPRRLSTEPARALAAGAGHACAVVRGGRVYCWGGNFHGQLGIGTLQSTSTPRLVTGLRDMTRVAAGARHTCAVRRDGRAFCWGSNEAGGLGDGSYRDQQRPVVVEGLRHVQALDVGERSSCALVEGGAVYCWGAETEGRCFDCSENSVFGTP